METSVQRYFQAGLAPSTQCTYITAMKRFNEYCVVSNICDPLPVTEMLLCSFAAYLADQGLNFPPNSQDILSIGEEHPDLIGLS